jgi:thiosulfate dehydrogenase [quinone] large subunit
MSDMMSGGGALRGKADPTRADNDPTGIGIHPGPAEANLGPAQISLGRIDPPSISAITRAQRRAVEEAGDSGALPDGYGQFVWALTRIALGMVFLWAFVDRLFGLGKPTPKGMSWLDGVSPTTGYLSGVNGPLDYFFNQMAGEEWADWLFMIGLAGIGLALILGIGLTVAAITGGLLLVFMWMASLPIAANPFLDDHLIYALVLAGLAASRAGLRYSLAPWWRRTALVKKLPLLQ